MESFDRSLTRFLENENAHVFLCDASLRLLAVGPRLLADMKAFVPGCSLDELFPAQTCELDEARRKLRLGAPFFSTKFESVPFSSTIYLLPILEKGNLTQALGCLDSSIGPEAADALTAVLPGFSRQYRAPLSNLLNILSSVAVQCQVQEDYQLLHYLNEAAKDCYQMLRGVITIADYFTLAGGKAAFQPKYILLNSFLEELCLPLRFQLANVDYKLELKIPGETMIVSADERLLARAVYHLIANSCKYSPRGSTITVSLSALEKTVSLSVADEGDGIGQADYENVFQPFFTKPSLPDPGTPIGLGLGLPIVREIVRLHKGSVLVTSELNQGTTIAVSLPRVDVPEGELSLHSPQKRYANDRFSDLTVLFYGLCDLKLY